MVYTHQMQLADFLRQIALGWSKARAQRGDPEWNLAERLLSLDQSERDAEIAKYIASFPDGAERVARISAYQSSGIGRSDGMLR